MAPKPRKKSILSDQVELVYAKSKCYLHPTSSKIDNVAGYLTISRGPNATNNDLLVSFTIESTLKPEELKIYQQADLDDIKPDASKNTPENQRVVSKPHTSVLLGSNFSIPISFIYSIQVRSPSMGMWYGSIVVNTQDGEKLPIVFFHDDESPSTRARQKVRNQNFETFSESGELFWGGVEFMQVLGDYCHLVKSTIEPSVYLVNPVTDDLRNFAPFKEKAKTPKPKASPPFQLPDVNKFIATAKWKVLETVATFSAKTKNQVIDLVEEHAPLPIRQLVNKPEVQKIGNEFEGARVYLAKWAAQVKEEAEESQKRFQVNDEMYSIINKELGGEILTDQEISKTGRREEISKSEWESFFDFSGRLRITASEVKDRIFHGGVSPNIRGTVWLFLLGVYPWDSSSEDREVIRRSLSTQYDELKLKWVNDEEKRASEFWKDQKHRIEKDINRTDRNLPLFKNKKRNVSISAIGSNVPPVVRESSPETPDEDENDDEFDVSNITNPHLYKMREILLTFNEYNENLGYVQGMTDLLSPLYVILQDESLAFWSFTKFMDRMERNFVRDQSGMKKQMLTLNQLVLFMLPNLFKHLEKCESTDLFFFFRMLLVWFKREFEWDDVLRLWEVLFTDYYSSQHHLFFALSVLSDNERIITQNLRRFDEVLKYMNDLSMRMNLNKLLVRSELLFLRFRRMIDIIDRENNSKSDKNEISPDLRQLLSRELVIQKEVERPEGVGGG
ncbi:GTPase-activating protein Gyp7p [[Candida] jaroonii]|uniref:GTPase-activating protein Gyp7p n=1 Tax=[Candida] jaroonii TaxID=467808 RepID=A0ACA9Y314_9ASCO|nr:GTPase-activating protein Gyp7p [[Candida] jaroonii]